MYHVAGFQLFLLPESYWLFVLLKQSPNRIFTRCWVKLHRSRGRRTFVHHGRSEMTIVRMGG